MELIDILDEQGNNTGEKKTKPEAHSKGLWHRAVHVWIVNSKNEVLLQRRGETLVNFPDMWDISVAGHVSAGEEPVVSALREMQEEVGLNLNAEQLKKIGEIKVQAVLNDNTYFDNEFDTVFIVNLDIEPKSLKMDSREVKDLRYIPVQELKKWTEDYQKHGMVPHPEGYKLLFESLKV